MKKRISALLIAILMVMFCLPISVSAEDTSTKMPETVGVYEEADDLTRWGIGEEYAIVPCNAGTSAVDLNGSNGTDITIHKSHRKVNQRWTLGKAGEYYYFKSKWNGKVIDVPNSNAVSGQALQGNTYNGTDSQLWKLKSMGDGTYSIQNKLNDSLVWDVQGSTWNNGAKITLFTQHKASNQRFRFVHVSTVEPMSDWGSERQDCSGSDWSVWDGAMNTNWYNSKETDQYINSAADLGGLVSLVMNDYDMNGKTIHLMCDIDLAGINWTPIGFKDHWFRGSFNGHNHAIIGLNNTNDDDCAALFGRVKGGTICNLAVKGTIKGNYQVAGIVALLEEGHIVNVYSEVSVINATNYREGGIAGAVAYGGFIDHCTQNAHVYSNGHYSHRGGIAGYSDGTIRYCVNNATVNNNWSCGGGIAGTVGSGIVEFCANHGTVGGGSSCDLLGGIVGEMTGEGVIFGCYNDGKVFSTDYDYIGGICGRVKLNDRIIGCINLGRVYGDDCIGGIAGSGHVVKCLNAGVVTGDDEVGGIGGEAESAFDCYVLNGSAAKIGGKNSNGGYWVGTADILNGNVCGWLNSGVNTYSIYGITEIFTQNIDSDPYPTFGSSKVTKSGSSYVNTEYSVKVEYERGYGSVEGAGDYKPDAEVTLTAKPAPGCVFDHYEVKTSVSGRMSGWGGDQIDCPAQTVKNYTEETIILTDKITKSYTVRAVFKIFDETPEDMKVTVKLELECTDDAGGWNSDILPVDLVDSAGAMHHWEVNRNDLDNKGEKVSHDFDLGVTSPVAVYVTPDFGGGMTLRSYGLKARMWVNGSGTAIESNEVTIRSGIFMTSRYGNDYMHISFENFGNSSVGNAETGEWNASYTTCRDAWEKGKSDASFTIRLESAWLIDSPLELSGNQSVRLDLNGYPIIRTIKKTQKEGELFKIGEGATLTIVDSMPSRKSCGNFTGGSIQGGRSDNSGGLIECKGTLVMTGGTLYNGGTTDNGGAIKLTGSGKANLTGTLISNCWSDKSGIFYQNYGGAIYMEDKAQTTLKDCTIRNCRAYDYGGGIYMDDEDNLLNCENVAIIACTVDDNSGGGLYQNKGETNWVGGKIERCSAYEYGGGLYQRYGKVYIRNVEFKSNQSNYHGGAIYCDSYDGLWLVDCKLQQNKSDGYGGAIYMNQKNLYLSDCSVISNASVNGGGGIYVARSCTIGVSGVTVIRGNDGEGSMDNLVLGSNALIYNHGLNPGSEIHLRSSFDGNVKLGGSLTSEYQLREYFRADYGKLELADIETVNTELRASIFSSGKAGLIIGAVIMAAAALGRLLYTRRKRKGETQ